MQDLAFLHRSTVPIVIQGLARSLVDHRPLVTREPTITQGQLGPIVSRRFRVLLATAETHPTHRADVRVLFGKFLPRCGIDCDLIAASLRIPDVVPPWGGGRLITVRVRSRIGLILADLAHQFSLFWRCFRGYDALIVRDKPFLGLIGLAAARFARIPFVYWMSFPMPDAYIEISRNSDGSASLTRRIYAAIRGRIGAWSLYSLIAQCADYLFVQSPVMLDELRERGLSHSRAMPVPMGVDVEALSASARLQNRQSKAERNLRSAVYLGTLNRLRRAELELMVDAAKIVGQCYPDFVLLVIGESEAEEEKGWLSRYAEACGATPWVRFTGWLPYDQGIQLASECAIGLSPFPRGPLFDSASPTKVIEYLAVGLPAVCNDQPDQERVVRESGAGLCVDLTAESFASAISQLLDSPEDARAMGRIGRSWVSEHRDYRRLAETVANALRGLCPGREDDGSRASPSEPRRSVDSLASCDAPRSSRDHLRTGTSGQL